ncbi:MAG: DUF177 domain-containing protein [Ghiorsea sp.]|nr:DUF177 domain-containing protein [Ghiorsea sp.]
MSQKDKFNLTLQGLASSGRQWDEAVPLALLADVSFGDLNVKSPLFSDMLWKGSLKSEAGQFVLAGAWQMDVPRRCGRCNVEFALAMQADVHVIYELGKARDLAEEEELNAEDCEQEVLASPGELDMLNVLREQFWLAWQPMVVCSEDCKGLCLQCGVDLNHDECDCHGQVKENSFAALKDFKFDA